VTSGVLNAGETNVSTGCGYFVLRRGREYSSKPKGTGALRDVRHHRIGEREGGGWVKPKKIIKGFGGIRRG